MDKVLLKDIWSQVHNLLTHEHKQLATFEGCQLTISEVILYNLNDCSHL